MLDNICARQATVSLLQIVSEQLRVILAYSILTWYISERQVIVAAWICHSVYQGLYTHISVDKLRSTELCECIQ